MGLNLKNMTTESRNPSTMILAGCSAEEARLRLEKAGGHVRQAIG